MEYARLGKSMLQVSRFCMDTKDWGTARQGEGGEPSQEEMDHMVKHALEAGINFFETANYYHDGLDEIYLGNALRQYADREQIRIALKFYDQEDGLSRKAIFRGIQNSLKSLRTDYIDLLILPKWDYQTPIKETVEALHDLIKTGYIRQIGAADMYAYQFMKAQETARMHGWRTFVTMQSNYSLLYREDERELLKLLKEENVSVCSDLSWMLNKITAFKNDRKDQNEMIAEKNSDVDYPVLQRMSELAEKHDATLLQIATAWFFAKEDVVIPVIGIKGSDELDEMTASLQIKLSPEEMRYLEEPYMPHGMMEMV